MSILPFIEEQELGDIYQFLPKSATYFMDEYRYDAPDNTTLSPPVRNRTVVSARIATLTCPSDLPQVNTTQAAGVSITYHNYVANYGNTNPHRCEPSRSGQSSLRQIFGSPFTGNDWDLILPPDDITKFPEIVDGISKTLMVSET
ncbi:MAG: DUF1559 domain-containing protein, partial [Sphingomonadales bacterium]|nr:DUF1559 domain-containing protein [Sphingomonadales bacterium]